MCLYIKKYIYKISRALEVSAFLHLFTATPFSKHAFIRCLNVCAHRRSFLFEEMTECLFLLIDLRRSFFHRLRGSEWVMAFVLCRVPTQRAGLFIPGSTGRRNSFPLFPFSPICISTARCRWRNPDLGGWKCIFFSRWKKWRRVIWNENGQCDLRFVTILYLYENKYLHRHFTRSMRFISSSMFQCKFTQYCHPQDGIRK